MKLSPETVREFIAIYKAEFGKELTGEEAESMGFELLSFYLSIMPEKKDKIVHINNTDVKGDIRNLRRLKKLWVAETFSANDLKNKLNSELRGGVVLVANTFNQ